jgi:hypothetical protein
VDPAAVVAPRAKAVVVREHIKRKGRNLLGRSPLTGRLMSGNWDGGLYRSPTESSNAQRQRRAELQAERERQREAGSGGERGVTGEQEPSRQAQSDTPHELGDAQTGANRARQAADP